MRLVSLCLIFWCFLPGCSRRSEPEPLILGHVGTFSGRNRAEGEAAESAIRLALAEINGDGGRVEGRKVVVLHADDRATPALARGELVRLITVSRASACFGGTDFATASSMAQALRGNTVPVLTASPWPNPPQDWLFSIIVAPEFHGRTLAKFAQSLPGVTGVVLLVNASQPACVACASAFEKRWRTEIKKPAVLSQYEKDSELPTLAEAARKQPQWAVVFAGSASEFIQFRTVLKAEKDRPLLFAGEPAELARLGESGTGAYAATVYNPALFVDAGKKFVTKYRDTTRREPDFFALSAWEMTQVLAEALRVTRGAPAGRLREELARDRSWTGLHEFKFEKSTARRSLFVFRLGDPAPMKEFGPE